MTRRLLALPAIASLGLGSWVGLARLGWVPLPGQVPHGPLLMLGFLGTLIALERAIALNRWWAWMVPAVSGLAALTLVLQGWAAAAPLFGLSGLGLVGVQAYLLWLLPSPAQQAQLLGALCQVVGTGLASPWWWANFLIFTILGERLELSGRRPPSWLYLLAVAVLTPPSLLWGLALVGLAIGLARVDVARRTALHQGLPAYCGRAVLMAYGWLAVAGMLALTPAGGLRQDALIHALTLGFVMTMVMAHAPLLVGPVFGRTFAMSNWIYGPLLLHQLAVAGRLGCDLAGWGEGRALAGLANAFTLLSFGILMGLLTRPGRKT